MGCTFLTKVVFVVHCETKLNDLPSQDQTHYCHSLEMHSIGAYHKDVQRLHAEWDAHFLLKYYLLFIMKLN
jgi:hypothetical protein